MFEFLEAAHSYLTVKCQQFRQWISILEETSIFENAMVDNGDVADGQCQQLLEELVLSVQRVILRHSTYAKKTEENSSEFFHI